MIGALRPLRADASWRPAASARSCDGTGTVLPHAESGLLQLLLDVSPQRLGWFVDRHLGPILDRPDLVATLRAWLATSGSRQAVAALLHLHRNSVGYRVGLLKSLLGVDPLQPEHAAVLHAALAAHDLLGSDARARVPT